MSDTNRTTSPYGTIPVGVSSTASTLTDVTSGTSTPYTTRPFITTRPSTSPSITTRQVSSQASSQALSQASSQALSQASSNVPNNPLHQMNKVIVDISGSTSYSKNDLYQEVKKLHSNYTKDMEYMDIIHNLIETLKGTSVSTIEKTVNHNKKQQDIQEYYHQRYEQQIFIVKLVILFSFIAMVGCLLFNYGIISVYLLTFYLGFVFSIGFVVIFYYLWDLSVRNKTVFDEYDFETYLPPKSYGQLEKHTWSGSELSDNNILC